MKRLLLGGLLLGLIAGGYYSLGISLETRSRDTYDYMLQSDNVDELNRFAPAIAEQMRRLPILPEVVSDLQVKKTGVIGSHRLMLAGITISFKRAPWAALGEAIDQVQRMERGRPLPATITTSFIKRAGR